VSIIKPAALKKGDLIGLISPASKPADENRVYKAAMYFESLGYRVKIGKHALKSFGYLAGTDEERLSDLHEMFKDTAVKAVICLRGGYGSGKLLPNINWQLIKKNPKIFVGYSDITSLQMAMLQKTGLVTFAGPMAAVDFYGDVSPYTEENFWRMVTSPKKPGVVPIPETSTPHTLLPGKGEGRLIGGNMALFTALLGSGLLPDPAKSLLVLEDVDEPPYRIDRMINQLLLAGYWQKTSGVILGDFGDTTPKNPDTSLTLTQVISHYASLRKGPVITGFPHGHIKNLFTIPFGVQAKVVAAKSTIEITEGAVEK